MDHMEYVELLLNLIESIRLAVAQINATTYILTRGNKSVTMVLSHNCPNII